MRDRLALPQVTEPFFEAGSSGPGGSDGQTGIMARVWYRFFSRETQLLTGIEPLPLRAYTVAQLHSLSPADWQDCSVMVTDEHAGRVPAYSDGVKWRRYSDNLEVTT